MRKHFTIPVLMSGVSDTTAPTFTITALSAVNNVVSMQIVASEQVSGFVVGDITISAGGSLASFATADNITFTVSWTLAAGANTMDINAGVCTDLAGNANTAASQVTLNYLSSQPDSTTAIDMFIQDDGDLGLDSTTLQVGEHNELTRLARGLIKFPALSGIPALSTIYYASLTLTPVDKRTSNNRTMRVYRQKRNWTLTYARWSIYDNSKNWQTAGGFGANDCEQTEIGHLDMTPTDTLNVARTIVLTASHVEDLTFGYGWMLKMDTETNDQYHYASSAHATAAYRPKLDVVWQANP